jgi:hypothetical protein
MDTIQPDPCGEREQQVWQQAGGRQEAHLFRFGVEDKDGDKRDRQQRDLIADYGDRLAEPQVAEVWPA